MALRGGVMTFEGPDGRQEFATFTCAHCQQIVRLTPARSQRGIIGRDNLNDIGATCSCCNRSVCLKCSLTRDPWLAKLDRMEDEAYRKSQNAKAMGA